MEMKSLRSGKGATPIGGGAGGRGGDSVVQRKRRGDGREAIEAIDDGSPSLST